MVLTWPYMRILGRFRVLSAVGRFRVLSAVKTSSSLLGVVFKLHFQGPGVLDLQTHTVSPLSIDRFHNLMDQCLASGNIQAHYVRGIHEYFRNDNAIDGMYHLRLSAYVYYVYGVYLYDIIMLCRGEQAVSRAYLDMLGWRESPTKLD
ncbi:hypothetical protein F2Q69_00049348 [Brassica cretica]|uniref:At2g35280-like TPR domain-containing protein n=1 Tax=Brassica cretica TaxID=69181 RepID=A0A8S9PPI6_BRACR|nr:hypothetical protein F2Q69_00049348 [Brassica cretica]